MMRNYSLIGAMLAGSLIAGGMIRREEVDESLAAERETERRAEARRREDEDLRREAARINGTHIPPRIPDARGVERIRLDALRRAAKAQRQARGFIE